jgi:hypothetical protein
VSAQLGNRVQHALRAFTPKEQKAVRAAAQTFRPNPELNVERTIQELQVGEALVSVLFGYGQPSMVQRTLIRPPMSRVGPLTADERQALIAADTALHAKYTASVDRESAHERLLARNTAVGQVKDKIRRFGNLLGLSR